jgi:hypothetical protein
VTVLGLSTLLWGAGYAALGGSAVLAGAGWFVQADKEPWIQVIALGGIIPAFLVVIGLAFLVLGMLGLLAGSGTLARKPWGRILTLILGVLAIVLGLGSLSAYEHGDSFIEIAPGILIKNRAEFSRPRLGRGDR